MPKTTSPQWEFSINRSAYFLFAKIYADLIRFCLMTTGRPAVAIALMEEAAMQLETKTAFIDAPAETQLSMAIAKIRQLAEKNPGVLTKGVEDRVHRNPQRVILFDVLKFNYFNVIARYCIFMNHEGASVDYIYQSLVDQVNRKEISDPSAKMYVEMGAQGIQALLDTEWSGVIVEK